jgi:hypothetical protein
MGTICFNVKNHLHSVSILYLHVSYDAQNEVQFISLITGWFFNGYAVVSCVLIFTHSLDEFTHEQISVRQIKTT